MTNEQLEGVVDMVTNSQLKKELLERVDVEAMAKKVVAYNKERERQEAEFFKNIQPGDTFILQVAVPTK